jgi:2-polyprenyl-3-methyl-5-hydroxy-6-metoxy-1,4-benzoquinol methylase
MKKEELKELRELIQKNWKEYINFTKDFFEKTHHLMTVENHERHNHEKYYKTCFLDLVVNNEALFRDTKALDFGCGCGRNIKNLLDLNIFSQVDGCDISKKNAEYSKKYVESEYPEKSNTWETDGYTLEPAPDNEYSFIMSHIVLQHIANWHIRYSIIADVYRTLKPGGLTMLHFMDLDGSVSYKESYPKPGATDYPDLLNCRVEDNNLLIDDFNRIGFKEVGVYNSIDPFSGKMSYFVKGVK